jgi:hypothetical protein
MSQRGRTTTLQQRKVFRALTLYCVTCWVLLQVADLVLPVFHTPGWVLKRLIMTAVIGMPIVAVLAWLFELTGEGLVSDDGIDEDTPASAPSTHPRQRARHRRPVPRRDAARNRRLHRTEQRIARSARASPFCRSRASAAIRQHHDWSTSYMTTSSRSSPRFAR